MAVNPFNVNDFVLESRENVTEQFKDKAVFLKYLDLLLGGSYEALLTLRDLMQLRSIDTATGEQLDVLGRIVGQGRVLIGADTYKNFAFEGVPISSTFGSKNNEELGGYWYSAGRPAGDNIVLNDDQYRTFIKAKIMQNTTTGTVEDTLRFLNFVFGVQALITYNEGGKAIIRLNRRLSPFERALSLWQNADNSHFIPRPLGVTLEIVEPENNGTLGFMGTPFALGMVSLYSLNPTGGVMGSVYIEE